MSLDNFAKSIDLVFAKSKALTILKRLQLFNGLFEHEFNELLGICKIHYFSQYDCVFEEGDGARSLFVILSGVIEFSTTQKGVINLLKEGDVFGEMGVITQNPRAASAYCLDKDSVVLEIAKGDFDLMLGKAPRVSYILMKNMAAELAERYLQVNKESFSLRSNSAPQAKNIAIKEDSEDQLIPILPSLNYASSMVYFKISKIHHGQLFLQDSVNRIHEGNFIYVSEAKNGVIFKPTLSGVKKCWFEVESSSDGETVQLGSEKTRVHVFVY